ncbi:MAG: hypothetical protein J5569_02395 [Oscillospiraceae bacterium]|nr:hypothetical protein [Oscillospiraceae bacterium]
MNGYDLIDAVGAIDEKYVAEASAEKKSTGRRWVRWGALAACLCIIVGGVYLATRPRGGADIPAPMPAEAAEVKPAPVVPAPVSKDDVTEQGGGGLYIPAIDLPENTEGEMDMIGLIVYRGGIYTQSGFYSGDEALAIEPLVGEYLGTCDGTIDEWSAREEYERDFAGNIPGDFYAVEGYDIGFRICMVHEWPDETGSPTTVIEFFDRLNDITLTTGGDLFENRLHLRGRVEDIVWQSHDDWNWNRGNFRDAGFDPGTWDAFIDTLDEGGFVYTWDPDRSSAFYEGVPNSRIYDTPNQAHLTLSMEDGTRVELRLIEGGYVGYGPLNWYFVKMPGDAFDAVYDACGGTHETGWAVAR